MQIIKLVKKIVFRLFSSVELSNIYISNEIKWKFALETPFKLGIKMRFLFIQSLWEIAWKLLSKLFKGDLFVELKDAIKKMSITWE